MSMKPDLSESAEENVTEVNLDGPDTEETEVSTEVADEDLFNGEPLDEEKDAKLMEAFGIEPDEEEEVTPDKESETEDEEDEGTEPLETEKESEDEKPKEPVVEPEKPVVDYEKRYIDSQREVVEVLLPAKKERDDLLAEKTKWDSEKEEIRGILRSDPELLNKFTEVAENYVPVQKPVAPVVDQTIIDEAVKKTIGEDGLKMLNDAKEKTEKERGDAIVAFEAAHPGLTSEERGILATQTAILEASLKIPLHEALERSFKATFPDRAFAAEKEKLEEAARVRAAKRDGATVTTTGSAGSTGSKKVAPALTAKELKLAKAFGLTAEEAAAQQD